MSPRSSLVGVGMDLVHVADGVELGVEIFGDPDDETVLLVAGATASMDWWEASFCERLAQARRFVVRYDHRDTGASTHWPAGDPAYDGEQLSLDVVRLLDALDLDSAHLVGVSMGGGLAQDIAVRWPARVSSLTLIATSCAFERASSTTLPGPEARISALFQDPPPEPDWADEDAVVEQIVEGHRPYAGSLGFDEVRVRQIARDVVRRTPDVRASLVNHWAVVGAGESDAAMGDVHVPTLVLHGTDDPMFPLAHGLALAEEIAGARLVTVEGMGHEHPPEPTWDVVVPAIVEHTRPLSRRMFELTEPICLVNFFSPEPHEAMTSLGFRNYWDGYFAGRAAPLGLAPAEVVHAAFYNFGPGEVARHIPKVWRRTTPEAAHAAREQGCVAALRRILGDLVESAELARAAELLAKASTSSPTVGRVMYAGLRALPTPVEPLTRLWHAANLLREHRGDGHVAALVTERIGGLEAHVLAALDMGIHPAESFGRIHHLPPETLAAVMAGLRERGLVDDSGHFTEAGRATKDRVEASTDVLAQASYDALSAAELAELRELLEPIAERLDAVGSA